MKRKLLVVIIFLIFLYGCSTRNSKNDINSSNIDIQYDDKKESDMSGNEKFINRPCVTYLNSFEVKSNDKEPDEFILCPPDLDFTSFAGDKFETITIGFSRILQGMFPVYGYTPEEPIYISLEIPSMMIKSDEYYGTTDFQRHSFSINEIEDIPSAIVVGGIYDISNITNFNINVNNVFKVWDAYPELNEKEIEDTLSESNNGISFTTIDGYSGVLELNGHDGCVFCNATIELKDNIIICITLVLPDKDVGIITYILQSISLK